jgi:guanylate kinase
MPSVPGSLFVVSAPSGAGKSSLLAALCRRRPGLRVAVSHTTRAPRPGERDGEHYHFVDRAAFLALVGEEAFLEHAQVFDHYYGTSEAAVREALAAGGDLVLEIDWQGARQVRRRFREACCIFILPPSLAALRERLAGRGQDSAAVIERRMGAARAELAHYPEYDYLVVNERFEGALEALDCIVAAYRLREPLQSERLAPLLGELLAQPNLSGDLEI